MKKRKTSDKKNTIITILAIALVISGLLNIFTEIIGKDAKETMLYNSSLISVQDGNFNKDYKFIYNSSYIKVELLENKNELKITPIKIGDTKLEINYITISGENKTVSYEINVRKGLSLEIENK